MTDTKQRMLDTAKELIWRDSYNATSVDEICKKSNTKKGSFYHYFPSKAHLALETMDGCMQETKEKYDEVFSPTYPALERFSLMVDYVIEQQREISKELGHVCGCPFATLGSELAAQDKEVGEKIAIICATKTKYYSSALRDLVNDGVISKETNIEAKADAIFALIVGELIVARIKNDLSSIENNLKTTLFDLIGVKET